MTQTAKILFVDDEPHVLDGLRRTLRRMHGSWDMSFASSGAEALTMLETERFDVVVSDMKMPKMSGGQLLETIAQHSPHMVRIVLSGQADMDELLSHLGPIHQFLAKPCDVDALRSTIARAVEMTAVLESDALLEIASRISSLPSWPQTYQDLMAEVDREDCSMEVVAKLISSDPGMTAKLLQLVNSAFFGSTKRITSVKAAVVRLGTNTIRSLLVASHIFEELGVDQASILSGPGLWRASTALSDRAQRAAFELSLGEQTASAAQLAGMLSCVGRLLLASTAPQEYEKMIRSEEAEGGFSDRERTVFGVCANDMGAYLLGLWGFGEEIVEAVQLQEQPSKCVVERPRALTAVHIARCALSEHEAVSSVFDPVEIDVAHLVRMGIDPASVGLAGEERAQEAA